MPCSHFKYYLDVSCIWFERRTTKNPFSHLSLSVDLHNSEYESHILCKQVCPWKCYDNVNNLFFFCHGRLFCLSEYMYLFYIYFCTALSHLKKKRFRQPYNAGYSIIINVCRQTIPFQRYPHWCCFCLRSSHSHIIYSLASAHGTSGITFQFPTSDEYSNQTKKTNKKF